MSEWVCVPCGRVFRGHQAYDLHCRTDVHLLVTRPVIRDPSVQYALGAMLTKTRDVPCEESEARRQVADGVP